MKRSRIVLLVSCAAVAISLALVLSAAWQAMAADEPRDTSKDKEAPQKFSGPFVHKNLAVFLIHGPDRIKDKEFLTLPEALDAKKAEVVETSTVSELVVKNTSTTTIYIQAGIIVKGGKQDRVIRDDYLIRPKEEIKISSFCVERGRWRARGNESADKFDKSGEMLATKELKLAARAAGDQQQVWTEVSNAQTKLNSNLNTDVRSKESASSLQLSLEDPKVKEALEEYNKALANITVGKDKLDVIGYAFAINGKVNSVDIYGCHALFEKLWPQLLKSAAVEAIANYEKDKKFDTPTADAVKAFLDEARKAKAEEKNVGKDVIMEVRDSAKMMMWRSIDKSSPSAAPLRENTVAK
ncbi:MAG: ARPP-1 family domain-containing protein [Phycisphaerae bacterium]